MATVTLQAWLCLSPPEREAWPPPTPEEDTSWSGFGEWAPEWAAKGVTGLITVLPRRDQTTRVIASGLSKGTAPAESPFLTPLGALRSQGASTGQQPGQGSRAGSQTSVLVRTDRHCSEQCSLSETSSVPISFTSLK